MDFVALCNSGLEELTAVELSSFGGSNVRSENSTVFFSGNLEVAYRACLWSRFSSKILLVIAHHPTIDDTGLYEQVLKTGWRDHLQVERTFAVECSVAAEVENRHSKFTALKVKDGIADYFREKSGTRPYVQTQRPDVKLHVYVGPSETTLSVDLSGESLHRRGYRRQGGAAPLKETLAAGIISLSGWDGESPLVDPMCGSGTLLIEAAMIYGDIAPGLGRSYFGLLGWLGHQGGVWDRLVEEAIDRETQGHQKKWPEIIGYDGSQEAIAGARKNLEAAGLEYKISVACREVRRLHPEKREGHLVSNPPYGERLSDKVVLKYLYRFLGNRIAEHFSGWRVSIFTSNPDLADMLGVQWKNQYRLKNGPISCKLYNSASDQKVRTARKLSLATTELPKEPAELLNRLTKNYKKLAKLAVQHGTDCFRLYNRDLPQYNACVDVYGTLFHVQEFAAPRSIDPEVARQRFSLIIQSVRALFGASREQVYLKKRVRQRGKTQYAKKKKTKESKLFEVTEGPGRFLVNLSDYLDTGLFLDHRLVRMKIGQMSENKRFLNLFGYTGAATVHAAMGGAHSTTTVDLSTHYLEWAQKNLAINGVDLQNHKMVNGEVMAWLCDAKQHYDLILVDPPTFSNTAKKKRTFDVQSHHGELLNRAMEVLEPGGTVIFSTNFRSFQLDESVQQRFLCEEITKQTIPFDFQGSSRIHRCWLLKKH
ncbi:MAG: bifunctional 23S rRNA (guanine(2069)-N(7))-methyltransferase RlmK/23S rRNA (guanine(2445)-N(2))-methyltransferase RlmL [Desulfobulbaceae bacterium]|nr:MAG: bifunctional 23S rRNA (guanine(2069)-N(7))-methyltransferase RlmK/23S rRNA (guanine(2445)-N(2))-methyltransferase RlmL [Desulfobulbaceae bacterium]